MAYFSSFLFQTGDLSSKSKPVIPQNGHYLKLVPDLSSGKENLSVWGINFTQHLSSFMAREGKPHCWASTPLWSSARSSTPVAFKVSITPKLFINIACVLVTQPCPTFCDPMGCCPPGSSIHVIFQARILEWIAISLSRVIFLTQGSNPGLLHCRQTLPSELPGKPY